MAAGAILKADNIKGVFTMKKPQLKDLTLREKVAQLMIVRFSDILMEPETNYTSIRDLDEAKRLMEEGQFGGIWLNGNVDINGVNDFYNKNFHYTSQTSRELYDWANSTAKYVHDNLTRTPCPTCGKMMLSVTGKKGQMLLSCLKP